MPGDRPAFGHGLIIGKFYPPHAGHHHLIDTAARRCRRVSVVVAASSVESIPLADRVAWLREAHTQPQVEIVPAVDDIEVDYGSDEVWTAHVEVIRSALRAAWGTGGARVDAVFSSEDYGSELARRFGAEHVPVDPPRRRVPVSGTAVRADPVAAWRWLSPPVRAYLTRRVAVVGAESTGTTTLTRALAAHFAGRGGPWSATRWVPEYGRTYCEEKLAAVRRAADPGPAPGNPSGSGPGPGPAARSDARSDVRSDARPDGRSGPALWIGDLPWESEEFTLIAERHLALTEAAARAGSPVLFCDTDAFATELWHERYLGGPAPDVHAVHRRAPHDLWILTDPEGVPFEQDGWRDGEHIRSAMATRFAEELDRRGLPYVTVTGPPERRLRDAADAVDKLLAAGWHFTDPL